MDESVAEKVRAFFRQYKPMKFRSGERIIRADEDEVEHIFYLDQGYVKQCLTTHFGEERIVNIFRKQAFFPIILVMNKIENHYSFEAMTDVVVYRSPASEVIEFLQKNSDVVYDLVKRLGRGLEAITQLRVYFSGHNAKIKIIALICALVHRFGKPYEKNKILIKLPLFHKNLAAISGLTRESISREMEQLEKEKIIKRCDKHYIVNNLSALEQILD